MTRDDVQRWLDRYVAAWKSYDPAAIVADWIAPSGNASSREVEGAYDASYRPWAVEGDRAVAVGTSDCFTDARSRAPESTSIPDARGRIKPGSCGHAHQNRECFSACREAVALDDHGQTAGSIAR